MIAETDNTLRDSVDSAFDDFHAGAYSDIPYSNLSAFINSHVEWGTSYELIIDNRSAVAFKFSN